LQGNANTVNTGTITQEHIKASILSAVEDKVRYLHNKMDGTVLVCPRKVINWSLLLGEDASRTLIRVQK
jgi:hypothetical protein